MNNLTFVSRIFVLLNVSAGLNLEVCGKLAFLSTYEFDHICDVVATEELLFRGALTSNYTNFMYAVFKVQIFQISCMQFSRYKSF